MKWREDNMKKALIGGLIGLIAGLAGGYFVGGYRCSRVYKDRIMELEEENVQFQPIQG